MNHNHRLQAELDQHELVALQRYRYMVVLHEKPHVSSPLVIFSGLAPE
jgi:hypothetical protein